MADPKALVQRWDAKRVEVLCPYCKTTHEHGLRRDPSGKVEYDDIRRSPDCGWLGGGAGAYSVIFPFDVAKKKSWYEIDKQDGSFVSALFLTKQAASPDADIDDHGLTKETANNEKGLEFKATFDIKAARSACITGDFEQAKEWIRKFRGTDDLEFFLHGKIEDSGNTVLSLAAMEKTPEIVALLLKYGSDVNAQNRKGRTPLMEAALWGRVDNVRILLKHEADKTLKDRNGKRALDLAALTEENEKERDHVVSGYSESYQDRQKRKHLAALLDDPQSQDQLFPEVEDPQYVVQLDRSIALVKPLTPINKSPDGWKHVALLSRGGHFPPVHAYSRDINVNVVEIAVDGQPYGQLANKIAALVGFTLSSTPSQELDEFGQCSASHAEMQLIAYFVDKHLFLPGDFVSEDEMNKLLEWRENNRYGDSDDEDDARINRNIALTELQHAQPAVGLEQAIVVASSATCADCEKFCELVNSQFGLDLRLQYSVEQSGYVKQEISIESLAARCGLMHEAQDLCRCVLSRLKSHLGGQTIIIRADPNASMKETVPSIETIATRFSTVLEQLGGSKPVISRLASTRFMVNELSALQGELDRLNGSENAWKAKWEVDVASMKRKLTNMVEQNLHLDEPSDSDSLTLLALEVKDKKNEYSGDEMALLQRALKDILGLPTTRAPEVDGWLIPRHEIQFGRKIEKGGFGEIFLGVWRKKEVVIKCVEVLSETDRRTFMREVRVWKQASHPNIVPFLKACHIGSPCFIVCKYAEQGTLPDYLEKQRREGRSLTWRRLYEVALGLLFLHDEGIVHGDLKGNNILVSKDTAMLTDFGLSFDQSGSRANTEHLGALEWRAPEIVLQNGARPSFEADVYSLGMCIVEAVTGEPPWKGLSNAFFFEKRETMKRPKNMTDEEWALVEAMIAFEPSARMKLADVVQRIEDLAEDEDLKEQN